MSKAKRIFKIFTTVILIALIVLVAFMFFTRLTGNAPSLFGYHFFRVSSGSMEPELMIGDVILTKDTPPEGIKKGDIITYKSESGEMKGYEITHRVVTEPSVTDGVYKYQTQGDAKGAPLDPVITYDQVVGKYICKIPLIDKLYSFFLTKFGLITIVAVIIVAFGYEMISLFLSYRSFDKKADEYLKSEAGKAEEESSDKTENADTEEKTDHRE